MTLRELEKEGLLQLPSADSWEKYWPGEQTYYSGDLKELKLTYVNVWGKTYDDKDSRFLLQCVDSKDDHYTTEIIDIDETISRYFLSVFGVENYGKSILELYDAELIVKGVSASLRKPVIA
jgi:hypothetical protein